MKNFTYFLIKTLNKVFIRKLKGNPQNQDLFTYFQNLYLEGRSYGLAGNIIESGEINSIRTFNKFYKNPKPIIFDVGANKGQFQNELINHLSIDDYTIHSFEPSPSTFQILNKEYNKNCVNHNVGFGNKKETLKLFRTSLGSPLSSLHQKIENDYYNVKMEEFEEVQIERLDDFCSENNIKHIDFLKLDIEGHEYFALQGASKLINEGNIDFIQFEFGPPNIDSRTYLRDIILLLNNDYHVYQIMSKGLYKLEYKETDEIFLPVNYLAIRKSCLKPEDQIR